MRLSDLFTFLSLVMGVFAVLATFNGYFIVAGEFLLFAVVFDVLDGRVARWRKETSEFGMYLDSLADIVVFGAVPVFIALLVTGAAVATVLAGIVFLAAGVFRLARFQHTRLKNEYQGMPITLNGIFVPLALFFVPVASLSWVLPAFFVLSSALMISTFKVRKL